MKEPFEPPEEPAAAERGRRLRLAVLVAWGLMMALALAAVYFALR